MHHMIENQHPNVVIWKEALEAPYPKAWTKYHQALKEHPATTRETQVDIGCRSFSADGLQGLENCSKHLIVVETQGHKPQLPQDDP